MSVGWRVRRWWGAPGRVPLVVGAVLCLAAAGAGVPVLVNERRTQDIVDGLAAQDADRRGALLEAYQDVSPERLSPRAAAALAELAVEEAQATAEPGRRTLYLAQAGRLVARAAAARPGWGTADLLAARLSFARSGRVEAAGLRALAASYAHAPFLFGAARWRVALAVLGWPALDSATRRAAIAEAVWACSFDGGLRREFELILGDTPAALAFQLALDRAGRR